MIRFLAHLAANGLTLVILARLLPSHVDYDRWETVALFAGVLALLNVLVRPVLQLIALPLTCLTLGIFALIVNAAVFYLAGWLVDPIEISYLGAFVGSLVAGVLNAALVQAFTGD